ncbi:hypothetical protein AB1L42_03925 [Thalassoglobus sp. JC818]|uniref:hypothetical protein n=1 Tax=Thalassoglobus sp. JC818 TaxID=3232136 RepID=UPI0034583A84
MRKLCRRSSIVFMLLTTALWSATSTVAAASTEDLITQVQSVGRAGSENSSAAKAVNELQQMGPETLRPLLVAMNDANPVAMNWLQVAFESIADQSLNSGQLPAEQLEEFVTDRTHNGRARRVAFDWLSKADPSAPSRLIPNMLDDPSSPLRREAVALAIKRAKAAESESAQKSLWTEALSGAVDRDQFDEISAALKKLGEDVNLVDHFGLITEWHLIGPFDNKDEAGFDVVYPPEKEIDLSASYDGMNESVSWQHFVSERKDGAFDLAELTTSHKGAIDYAYTEFNSPVEQQVEFRLATPNAWKLWINGELIFAREEYHRGMQFDQYIVPVHLEQGTNRILLKVCQNEQDQDWAQRWAFQFRVVDETGRAVASANK